jgi:hypothetical protein
MAGRHFIAKEKKKGEAIAATHRSKKKGEAIAATPRSSGK